MISESPSEHLDCDWHGDVGHRSGRRAIADALEGEVGPGAGDQETSSQGKKIAVILPRGGEVVPVACRPVRRQHQDEITKGFMKRVMASLCPRPFPSVPRVEYHAR